MESQPSSLTSKMRVARSADCAPVEANAVSKSASNVLFTVNLLIDYADQICIPW